MKNTVKAKKQFTPDYTLDFSKIDNYNDLVLTLITKRVKAGKTIDISDLFAYASACINFLVKEMPMNFFCCVKCANEPWYKKLWKRIKSFFKFKK